MKIYTSYYANLKNISLSMYQPISIAGRCHDWYHGLEYKKLAPKKWFFNEWKTNHDNNFYVRCFHDEVLNNLNKEEVIKELESMSYGRDVVLLCYEKPGDFCHRHLVAEWIGDVKEL